MKHFETFFQPNSIRQNTGKPQGILFAQVSFVYVTVTKSLKKAKERFAVRQGKKQENHRECEMHL